MAVTTITTTAAEDARIVVAFGRELGLGRNATAVEVKAAMIQRGVREIVIRQEAVMAQEALAAPAAFTPT